ncbi:hypothetical protein L596_018913 [Steinernema carpocapsae]|uniref:Uncharacterized protein n=1 Tax=Steinernema carpocapsae TaxID=34508 RepID=A0A4U5N6W2_STECR|nr:hypothetical protein L596_018913 [Steinernema carpocapsae]
MPFSGRLLEYWATLLRGNDEERKRIAIADVCMFKNQLKCGDYEKFGLVDLLRSQKTRTPNLGVLEEDYVAKGGWSKNGVSRIESEVQKLQKENAALKKSLEEKAIEFKKALDEVERLEKVRKTLEDTVVGKKEVQSRTQAALEKILEAAKEQLEANSAELEGAHGKIAELMRNLAEQKNDMVELLSEFAKILQ